VKSAKKKCLTVLLDLGDVAAITAQLASGRLTPNGPNESLPEEKVNGK
jgi:hypothetical protein